MSNNPLDELLNFAHRSYVRMEAEQVIGDCLEKEDLAPFETLLKQLVISNPPSIALLREVLEEIQETKSTLSQEGLGVRQDLMEALTEFGVYLPQLLSAEAPEAMSRICSQGLKQEASASASHLADDDGILLEEICIEAGNRVRNIARRLTLLNILERSVQDWMASVAYEDIRSSGNLTDPPKSPLIQ